MAIIKFKYAALMVISFSDTYATFLRGSQTSQNVLVPYTNANGQELLANEVLYTVGTNGTIGYIEVKSTNIATLVGSGDLALTVTHYPSTTQVAQNITFPYQTSNVKIVASYNSAPETIDKTVFENNRVVHVLKLNDFPYTDFDNDSIIEVKINGDVTGYYFNDLPYVSGTWVTVGDLALNKFEYVPNETDDYYEKENTFNVKDINGNVSTN